MATEILRPTGNINTLWAPNDYTLIDDPVESPTAGDGSVVEADGNDDNENQIWSLDAPVVLNNITDITLYVRHYFDDDGQPGVYDVQGNVKVGGSFLSSQTLTTSISGYIYDSVTWSGTWDAGTDFSDFQVSVQVGSLAGVEAYQIDVLYIELTGTTGGTYNETGSGGISAGGFATIVNDAAWYDSSWLYRVLIAVDPSKVPSSLVDFPVYVDMSLLPASFFANVKSDGGDIRITESDGTTEVPREVVFITTGSNIGEMHFKGDLSSSTQTLFFIYYGNSGASEPASDATYGSEAVWSDYNLVMHLNESVNTTTDGYADSTANANHGTGVSMSITAPDGQLAGKCAEFDGSADYISIPTATSIELTNNFCASCWCKRDTDGVFDGIIAKLINGGGSNINGWEINFRDTSHVYAGITAQSNSFTYVNADMSANPNDFDWHHLVIRINSGTMDVILDSDPSTASSTQVCADSGGPLLIGRIYSDLDNHYLDGKVDEVRHYNGVLSDNWFITEYNNQKSVNTFYTTGSQEEYVVNSYDETASGGIEGGSSSTPLLINNPTISGGIEGAGLSIVTIYSNNTGTGGIEGGNVEDANVLYNLTTSGGIESAGDSTNSIEQPGVFGSGGIEAGSSGNANIILNPTVTDGISGGGDSPVWGLKTHNVLGGMLILGSGNIGIYDYKVSSGGINAGGTADPDFVDIIDISGGIEAAGSADNSKEQFEIGSGGILAVTRKAIKGQYVAVVDAQGGSELAGSPILGGIQTAESSGGIEAGATSTNTIIAKHRGRGGMEGDGIAEVYVIIASINVNTGALGGGLAVNTKEQLKIASGGIESAGLSDLSIDYYVNAEDGALGAGVASIGNTYTNIDGSGGAELGGIAHVGVTFYVVEGLGGSEAGGVGESVKEQNETGSDGVLIASSAINNIVDDAIGAGGALGAGEILAVEYWQNIASGGITAAGNGNNNLYRSFSGGSATGGVATGGTVDYWRTLGHRVTGQVTIGGTIGTPFLSNWNYVFQGGNRIIIGGNTAIRKDFYEFTSNGLLISVNGSADFDLFYYDVTCDDGYSCEVKFPNEYRECFKPVLFEPRQGKGRPRWNGRAGTLPAITACQQYLYLPSQKDTSQEPRRGL